MELACVLAFKRSEREARKIIDFDILARSAEEDHVARGVIDAFRQILGRFEHCVFRLFQDAVETTKGRMTLPYSDCLKSPRRISAIDQAKLLRL